MLFIDGGKLFLDWLDTEKLWIGERLAENREILEKTEAEFRKNFWIEGNLVTNQPARLNFADPPEFRHGVCERGGPECLVYGGIGFGGIDWTRKDQNNRYQCATCIQSGTLPAAEPKIYNLVSVSMVPLYFGSDLFSTEELSPAVRKVFDAYIKSGILSSRIAESETPVDNKSVGYDYGLILNALILTKHKGAEQIYTKTLSITDDIGAWSEYYINDEPSGTRCRPWESGINLEALIKYAATYSKSNH
jgi:hypothetical protein